MPRDGHPEIGQLGNQELPVNPALIGKALTVNPGLRQLPPEGNRSSDNGIAVAYDQPDAGIRGRPIA